jgi:PTS system, lactose/cellobiose family IIC component
MKKDSLFDKFVGFMEGFGNVVTRINPIMAIKDSFIDLMPLIIAGSFGTLMSNVICSPQNGLAKFAGFGFLSKFQPLFNAINFATMSMISVFLVYLVASSYAEYKKVPKQMSGLIALACFVILIPTVATVANKDGSVVSLANVIASKYTDSKGMFLAIIVGLTSTFIYAKLQHSDRMKIKMPEGVPTGVTRSFEALFPAIITCFIFGVIGYAFNTATGGMYISDAIYKFLQTPMLAIMQLPAGIVILTLIAQCFWIIGIHGANIIDVVRSSVGLAAIAANLAAFQAGKPLPNVFTYTFWNTFCTIGGSGCTIGLIIAVILVSKRKDLKQISRLSIVPAIFGINEPLIFGIPIVLNPYLAIPFILAPMVSAAIGFFATSIGLAGAAMITVPWTTPPLINAYLSTGGNIGTVITQLVCIAVSVLIYLPFVKVMNKEVEVGETPVKTTNNEVKVQG